MPDEYSINTRHTINQEIIIVFLCNFSLCSCLEMFKCNIIVKLINLLSFTLQYNIIYYIVTQITYQHFSVFVDNIIVRSNQNMKNLPTTCYSNFQYYDYDFKRFYLSTLHNFFEKPNFFPYSIISKGMIFCPCSGSRVLTVATDIHEYLPPLLTVTVWQ